MKKSTSSKGNSPYKEVYEGIKRKEYIEAIIEDLEGINFRWVSEQYLEELPHDKKPTGLPKGYQWLVRIYNQAADPQNDKIDFKLMFGIKFMGTKDEKVYVFYKGKRKAVLNRRWKKLSNINLKKKKIALIFPSYMSIEDRKKWRYLRRKVENGKELGPNDNKFYLRYLPEVQNLDKKAQEEKSQNG